jgi:hypothetical protein
MTLSTSDRVSLYRRFYTLMKEHFGDDDKGRKKVRQSEELPTDECALLREARTTFALPFLLPRTPRGSSLLSALISDDESSPLLLLPLPPGLVLRALAPQLFPPLPTDAL